MIKPENVTSEPELDIAVLHVPDPPWGGGSEWEAPDWARVDRSATGEVADCEAVGFPLWQMDPTDETRSIAELRGTIRRLEDATSRNKFLVFRDVELSDVGVPESVRPVDKNSGSVWGGLSGALVFASGRGIGIVVQHHPRQGSAAIRVLPIDRVVEASTAKGAAIAKALFLPNLDRFPWAFPDATGALVQAKRHTLRLSASLGVLQGREREIAALTTLCEPRGAQWRWVCGDAYSGKTSLLAWFASNPPPHTTVASCLLSRADGRDSAIDLLDSLIRQLAAIAWKADYSPPINVRDYPHQFRRWLETAADACARRGDRLLLLVDGLDEYDRNATAALRQWLPVELPLAASMVVSSRRGVDVGIPEAHPLRTAELDLQTFEGAQNLRELAREELDTALRGGDFKASTTLSFLAVTGGGLTTDELTQLLRREGFQVTWWHLEQIIRTKLDRTVSLAQPYTTGREMCAFTHDTYVTAARQCLDAAAIVHARRALDDWADHYRVLGWPPETPGFLLRPYVRYLRQLATDAPAQANRRSAVDRICETVTSPGQWVAIFRAEGSPVWPEAEIVESQKTVQGWSDDGGLGEFDTALALARLGLARRGGNRGIVAHIARPLVAVWTLAGDENAAVDFANAVQEPDARAGALGEIAVALAKLGSEARFAVALKVAVAATPAALDFADRVRGCFAHRLARVRKYDDAEWVARSINYPEERAVCLGELGLIAARTDRAEQARSLARQISGLAVEPGFREGYRPFGVAAEIFALTGAFDEADKLIAQARSSDWDEHEWKYRDWANVVIETARWRCRAIRAVKTSPSTSTDEAIVNHPELTSWFDEDSSRWWSRKQITHAVNIAAALAEAGRHIAAHRLATMALRPSTELAENPEGTEQIRSTPKNLTKILLDVGLVEPVIAAVNDPPDSRSNSRDGSWSGALDEIRSALAPMLAERGRVNEAERHAEHIESELIRIKTRANMAYFAVLGADGPQNEVRGARRTIDALLRTAIEMQFRESRAALRKKIERRLAGDRATVIPVPAISDVRQAAERALSKLRDTEDQRAAGLEPDDHSFLQEMLTCTRALSHAARELAQLDPALAETGVRTANKQICEILVETQGAMTNNAKTFAAGSATVEALHRIGDGNGARSLATMMLTVLSKEKNSRLVAECLGSTVAAFGVIDGFSGPVVEQLAALARSAQKLDKWTGLDGAAALAVKLASAAGSVPALAQLAADLVIRYRDNPRYAVHEWYRLALDVLTDLVRNRQDIPSAEVAKALLAKALDERTVWADGTEILGGLVRVAESTTKAEAMRHFLTTPAFSDYAANLPVDLLKRLLALGALTES